MTLFWSVRTGNLSVLAREVLTDQRRNHSALRNTLLPRRIQQQFQKPQNRIIINPPGHLLQYDMMFYRVKVGPQIKIDDVGLAFQNRLPHALDRGVRSSLRPVAIRPPLKLGLEDRFQDQLQCSLDHPVPMDGIESTRTLFPSFGISTWRVLCGRMSALPTPCEAGPEIPLRLRPPRPQTSHHKAWYPALALANR